MKKTIQAACSLPVKKHILFAVFTVGLLVSFLPFSVFAATYDCGAGLHNYAEVNRVEAAATVDGKIDFRCKLCGAEMTRILFATDHIWGPWIIDEAASCARAGERHRVCTRGAGHEEAEVIPVAGHDYRETVTKEPACTAEGVKTFTCSRCGDIYTEAVAAPEHDYKETIIREPACTVDGIKKFTCSICGGAYTEPVSAALGHDYTETVSIDPACTEDGVKTFTCTYCGDTYTETLPALGHEFGEWIIKTQAKPGVPGLEERVCVHGDTETREILALPVIPTKMPFFTGRSLIMGGINLGLLAFFAFLIYQYVKWSVFFEKRRKMSMRVKELRGMVANKYGFE